MNLDWPRRGTDFSSVGSVERGREQELEGGKMGVRMRWMAWEAKWRSGTLCGGREAKKEGLETNLRRRAPACVCEALTSISSNDEEGAGMAVSVTDWLVTWNHSSKGTIKIGLSEFPQRGVVVNPDS